MWWGQKDWADNWSSIPSLAEQVGLPFPSWMSRSEQRDNDLPTLSWWRQVTAFRFTCWYRKDQVQHQSRYPVYRSRWLFTSSTSIVSGDQHQTAFTSTEIVLRQAIKPAPSCPYSFQLCPIGWVQFRAEPPAPQGSKEPKGDCVKLDYIASASTSGLCLGVEDKMNPHLYPALMRHKKVDRSKAGLHSTSSLCLPLCQWEETPTLRWIKCWNYVTWTLRKP